MATVYVIYSKMLDRYYVGSCLEITTRLQDHNSGTYLNSYTSKAGDWNLFWKVTASDQGVARKIEQHIKSMKSRKYIEHLAKYPELTERLLERYEMGSSR